MRTTTRSLNRSSLNAGFTLLEAMVGAALIVLTSGVIIYGFLMMNFRAMYARTMTASSETLGSLAEAAMSATWITQNGVTVDQSDILSTTQGPAVDLGTTIKNINYGQFDSTAGQFRNVPIYYYMDPLTAGSTSLETAINNAALRSGPSSDTSLPGVLRGVNDVTDAVHVSANLTRSDLGVRFVSFTTTVKFGNSNPRTTRIVTFKARD